MKQTITAQFDFNTFFESGALLQLSLDQFKLISGPFKSVEQHEIENLSKQALIYEPHFWDFLNVKKSQHSLLQGAESVTLSRQQLVQWLKKADSVKPQVAWQNVNSEPFKKQFQWSQDKFYVHKLQKTVPIISQVCRTRFTASNLSWVMNHLLSEEHFGWAYGFWQDGHGYFGQSPELIAQWNQNDSQLNTSALAGTLPNQEGQANEILCDPKIRQEHQFVVDDIRENLNQVLKSQQIEISTMQVLKLKHLLHLKTDFKCTGVDFQQAWSVVQALHPTAALGIYPRIYAEMKFFSEMNLQSDRRQFAAPFALIENGHMLCVAAIRSFYFSPQELTIFSGCGVTAESIYEVELSELEIKRESVKRMMGLLE